MPRVLNIRGINSDERLHFGVAKIDRNCPGWARKVIDEVTQVGKCRGSRGTVGLAVEDGNGPARVERNAIIHLQIVHIRSKLERMAPYAHIYRVLKLIGLVAPKLRNSSRNAQIGQRRVLKGDSRRVRQRSGQTGRRRSEGETDIRIRETQFVQCSRGKSVVPFSRERLRGASLLRVKRYKVRREIEEVRRQRRVTPSVARAQAVRLRRIIIHADFVFAGQADHVALATNEIADIDQSPVRSPTIRAQSNSFSL